MFSWMVVMCAGQIIADSGDGRLKKIVHTVKNKCSDAVATTKFVALATMYRCQDTLHALREPNKSKIEKSLDAVQQMKHACSVVRIGVDTEVELLQNIQALGFDQSNATKALQLFEGAHIAMQELMMRYQGFAPWNWTKKMEQAAIEVSHWVNQCHMYKLYFEGHKDCLQNWELLAKYCDLDATNVLQAMTQLGNSHAKYFLIYTAEKVNQDIKVIKAFLRDDEYKKVYAGLYQQLGVLLPVLQQLVARVRQTPEYKKQIEEQLQERYKQKNSK